MLLQRSLSARIKIIIQEQTASSVLPRFARSCVIRASGVSAKPGDRITFSLELDAPLDATGVRSIKDSHHHPLARTTRLDRLARSTRDLLNILDTVAKAGAGFKQGHPKRSASAGRELSWCPPRRLVVIAQSAYPRPACTSTPHRSSSPQRLASPLDYKQLACAPKEMPVKLPRSVFGFGQLSPRPNALARATKFRSRRPDFSPPAAPSRMRAPRSGARARARRRTRTPSPQA
jgi:hypothetical protein